MFIKLAKTPGAQSVIVLIPMPAQMPTMMMISKNAEITTISGLKFISASAFKVKPKILKIRS
ncbi:MAG: hypothetical protein COA94_00555 [Rickettsiales bacterium]|nr:MAG: hypothetical protein COA94_00555 [Rickettsiales bacterium]